MTFLGHVIDSEGLHMTQGKVNATIEASQPTNVTELKSWLGLVNYYARFLPNLSTALLPLYELLRIDMKWNRTAEREKAFFQSKDLLLSGKVGLLVHLNPNVDLILACDASSYGIGSVLSQKIPDGDEKPIAYASCTLTESERGYSQLKKISSIHCI